MYMYANSADPVEMAPNQHSHQDVHCLPFSSRFLTDYLFKTMDVSEFEDRRGHLAIAETQGWKS